MGYICVSTSSVYIEFSGKKNIKIILEHSVKRNGLYRTSINVGKFNREALI